MLFYLAVFSFIILFSFLATAESENIKAPRINDVEKEIYVCENSMLSYELKTSDPEEANLTYDIYPKDIFFIKRIGKNGSFETAKIFSGNISKSTTKQKYRRTLIVSDGKFMDAKNTIISTIEINNPPKIEKIGLRTISLNESLQFYQRIDAKDLEDGTGDSGKLEFGTFFLNGNKIFNVNKIGLINYTAKTIDVGNYDVKICVSDKGIKSPQKNINFCGQNGSSITSCEIFHLTITELNKAPTISERYPYINKINKTSEGEIYFNITTFDPDGSVPDVFWYVDGELKKENYENNISTFKTDFTCQEGTIHHEVKVKITDGLLSDSVSWDVAVNPKSCINTTKKIENFMCKEEWGCSEWYFCQNSKKSSETGTLKGKDYEKVTNECSGNSLTDESCGFQIRNCFDYGLCNSPFSKPKEIQICEFSINPNCFDRIKNCHGSGCEFAVDCGGPCEPCASCSDEIENQGEEGIDCGGPCGLECQDQSTKINYSIIYSFILFVAILLFLFLTVQTLKIIKMKRELKKMKDEDFVEKGEMKNEK